MSRVLLVVLSTSTLILSGCEKTGMQSETARSKLAQQLAGTWDVRFQLDMSPLRAGDRTASREDVTGRFAFLANRSLDKSYPGMTMPSNYGTYDIDFTSFGFDPRDRGTPPTVLAGAIKGDSLELILSPDEEWVSLTMRGRIYGDSIAGKWVVVFPRAGAGGGTFVMTSRRARGL